MKAGAAVTVCGLALAVSCVGAPSMVTGSAVPLSSVAQLANEYKAFLDRGRTPARAVEFARNVTGFKVVDLFADPPTARPGDRLLFVDRGRSAMFVAVGKQPLGRVGLRMIGAHIDTPAPKLLLAGVTAQNQSAIPTHRYGGIKRFHWEHRPLAIVGRSARADGTEVEVTIGLHDDFAFFAKMGPAGELVLTASSVPRKSPAARGLVAELHQRYGLDADDLATAELYAVPVETARDVGLDRALIGAHGQDDRSNSYVSWRAVADLRATPDVTAIAWLVDREEEGSRSNVGAQSRFLELVTAYLLRAQSTPATEANMHRALSRSVVLSADTPACINPNWPEAQEHQNAPAAGNGPAMFPFTGRGGKKGGSAAGAPLIRQVIEAFGAAGAAIQLGELGRVDEGGGGTISKYLAGRGMDVVDLGVCVISMHSPLELVSKQDLWSMYVGLKAFFAAPYRKASR